MVAGLLGAFAAAVCYGVASILQAVAVRRTHSAEGLDPRLLVRLFRSWPYLLGIGLDCFAFLLSIAALRSLPLFVVQSIVASFLAITAVLGAIFLRMHLRRSDWIALLIVLAGLVLVGLSAAEDRAVSVSNAGRWGVLVAAVALGVLAVPLGRISGNRGAAALGALAGLAFGAVAVAARVLPSSVRLDTLFSDLGTLLTDPSTYALILSGGVALLTYSTALQRGSVTQATAPLVIGETVAPALVGLLMLGDRPRPGWGWIATLGFILAVAGALSLSRHGDLARTELQRTP
ncbi:MAG TPA: EamA family transporter [Kribbella sp.]|uniref:EamA family transporter n=1 Tax=Kribbella sp. TaxID=1871183 RepID=UPI002D776475|nr:EamA family transporter [Kribbella sp.]HET6293611.1 EamA family transporter [Kribbella sp.]